MESVALMNRRHKLGLSAALVACSLAAAVAPAALASASLATVTVRIEGKAKTLLAATTAQTKSGFITKGGAPSGLCPYSSAQGALAVATHGRWSGKWSPKLKKYVLTKILGDTESGVKSHWELFVNNVAPSAGACEIALHTGEQLLFAAVPTTGPALYPLGIEGPTTVVAGQPFSVTVVHYNARGKAVPLAGATLAVGSHAGVTNSSGVIPLKASSAGLFTLQASASGYIRDEAKLVVTP